MRTSTGFVAIFVAMTTLLAGCAGTPEDVDTAGSSSAETLSVARTVAEGIERDPERDRVMAEIAVEYADAGYLDEASGMLDRIDGLVDRNFALAFVAARYAEQGNEQRAEDLFAEAQAITDEIQAPNQQAWMLSELAGRYLEAGQEERALETLSRALDRAESMSDRTKQAWLLAEIGSKYARADQPEKAAELLARAVKGSDDVRVAAEAVEILTWIAERQVDLGNRDEAGELLGRAEKWGERYETESGRGQKARSLTDIADDYLSLGREADGERLLSEALDMVDALEDPFWQTWTRVGAAQGFIALERHSEAREFLNKAFDGTSAIEEAMKRARVRTDIATTYVEMGDATRGLRLVRDIESRSEKAWALTRIAVIQREAGIQLDNEAQPLLQAIRDATLNRD